MVIVDASVVIAYFDARQNRYTAWLNKEVENQRIGITSLTMAEILQGIRDEEQFTHALLLLDKFSIFGIGSRILAIKSARNYRALRRRGITIRGTIDCLIATFCIEEGHILLHNDRDFDAFEAHLHLRVLHPTESTLH